MFSVSNGDVFKRIADKQATRVDSFWRRLFKVETRESRIANVANLYLKAGLHYYNENNLNEAINCYLDSSKFHLLVDNKTDAIIIYDKIADIIRQIKNGNQLDLVTRGNDSVRVCVSLEMMAPRLTHSLTSTLNKIYRDRTLLVKVATLYELLGDYSSAIEYYSQTLFDVTDYTKNHISYFNIAICHFYLNNIEGCLRNLEAANNLVKNDQPPKGEYIFCLVLIQLFILYKTDVDVLLDVPLSKANAILKQYESLPNYFKAGSSYFAILQNYISYIDNEDWDALRLLPFSEINEPVSYTHLDVYKRQILSCLYTAH